MVPQIEEAHRAGVEDVEEAHRAGVEDVSVFAPSIPTFDFLTDALNTTGAEVVVAPTRLDHPRLLDRFQGSGDIADKVRHRIEDRHLVIVDSDGTYRLA